MNKFQNTQVVAVTNDTIQYGLTGITLTLNLQTIIGFLLPCLPLQNTWSGGMNS